MSVRRALLIVGVVACNRQAAPAPEASAAPPASSESRTESSETRTAGSASAPAPESTPASPPPAAPHADASGRRGPPPDAELVEYAPDRRGFFYRPDGPGPFPVMVWNHGSEKLPGWRAELAHFYTAHGWAFLVPHRRGHGRSSGPYIVDEQDDVKQLALQDVHNEDVVAAIAWVKRQPKIDPARVAVSGCSYGGIQTLITAAKDIGIRAAVPFAPAAMRWRVSPPLQQRLIRAAREAKVPELLIQAENDYDLSPSRVVGGELEKAGHGRAKIYAPFGTGPQDGHSFCVLGFDTWGPDVLEFLASAMASQPAAVKAR